MGEITRSGPWLALASSGWTFRLLVGEDGLHGFVDARAAAPDGREFAGTLATTEDILSTIESYRESGECLSGSYFWSSSLVIVESLEEDLLFSVLADLVSSGEIESAFEASGDI